MRRSAARSESDYAAWTSSIDHIMATPGFAGWGWPHEMPLDENLRTYFKKKIEQAILLFEPRVILDDIGFEVRNLQGTILINLNYRIVTTNTRFNIVYPFYLKEGSEVQQ